jgi:hypothetical protein
VGQEGLRDEKGTTDVDGEGGVEVFCRNSAERREQSHPRVVDQHIDGAGIPLPADASQHRDASRLNGGEVGDAQLDRGSFAARFDDFIQDRARTAPRGGDHFDPVAGQGERGGSSESAVPSGHEGTTGHVDSCK